MRNLPLAATLGARQKALVTDSATFATPEADEDEELDLSDLLLEVLPGDGSTIGNQSAREALSQAAERQISEEEYAVVKDRLVGLGLILKGQGRGGTVRLAEGIEGGTRYEAPSAPAAGNGRGRAKKDLITQLTPRRPPRPYRVVHKYQQNHGAQRHPIPERPLAA
jgi:hypothetical protein